MYKILVVDDEVETLRMVEQFLEREGYIVDIAHSAREALALVDADAPELFVINTYLPGMDGLLLCRKLRDNPKTANTPIIFLRDMDHLTVSRTLWGRAVTTIFESPSLCANFLRGFAPICGEQPVPR